MSGPDPSATGLRSYCTRGRSRRYPVSGRIEAGDPATDLLVAWPLLPFDAHPTLRAAAGAVDDGTWQRARGWALTHAVACLASSDDNPTIAGFSRRGLAAVLADPDR